jgi:hypothetical protein
MSQTPNTAIAVIGIDIGKNSFHKSRPTGSRSAPPQTADIHHGDGDVRIVPICDIARDRRGLIERHADSLLLAPDDVTGNLRAVRLKDKIETLGDVAGVSNIERRPRNCHVAD